MRACSRWSCEGAGRRAAGLEQVQDMLGAVGRPHREEMVVGVGERPATADGDEPRIADLWQDHGRGLSLGIARHGSPTAVTPSGTERVTTLPAPMTTSAPMVTPGSTITPPPSHDLAPMLIG